MQITYQRFFSVAAAVVLTLCLLLSLCVHVNAESVIITDSASLAEALYQRSAVIQADVDAIDNYLTDVLTRYPAIGFDFNGYEGEIVGDTITMQMSYRGAEMLPVRYVDSREALMAAVTEAAVYCEEEIHLAMPASLREIDFSQAMTEAFRESALARTMLSGRSWEIWVNGYSDVMYMSLFLEYETDVTLVRQCKQKTEEEAVRLAQSLYDRDAEAAEIALFVHDALINRCVYGNTEYSDAENHSAYGVLINGYAVCEGYAEAFQLMMAIAGVECLYVEGDIIDGDRHGWNLILLEDGYYHVDLTWDDPVSESGTAHLLHDYLLLSDDEIAATHTWERAEYPAAKGELWSAARVKERLALKSPPQIFAVDYASFYSEDAVQAYEMKWEAVQAEQVPKDSGHELPAVDTTAPAESVTTTTERTASHYDEETTDDDSSDVGEPAESTLSETTSNRAFAEKTPSRWPVYLVSAMLAVILLGVLYAKYLY